MGATFYDLTDEELCDLMCGKPEDEFEDEEEIEEGTGRFLLDFMDSNCIDDDLK